MSATYTFTGQCYSKSGDTKKYESTYWGGCFCFQSNSSYISNTALTGPDTNGNYTYVITYSPENVDNGTVVSINGSSFYNGVSKSFAFSFTGTKSTGYYKYSINITIALIDNRYPGSVALFMEPPSSFTISVDDMIMFESISVEETYIGSSGIKYTGTLTVPKSDPYIYVNLSPQSSIQAKINITEIGFTLTVFTKASNSTGTNITFYPKNTTINPSDWTLTN